MPTMQNPLSHTPYFSANDWSSEISPAPFSVPNAASVSGAAPATGSGMTPAAVSGTTPAAVSGMTPATVSGTAPVTVSGIAPVTVSSAVPTGATGSSCSASNGSHNASGDVSSANPMGMTLTSQPLHIRGTLPDEVLESPTTVTENYLGSMKAMLMRNRGNFVVATLLIGTQGTTSWEGELFDVGNDYIVIYQEGRNRYIACDIFSLKYIEFYDSRRREICENLLRQNGWQNYC